MSLPALAHDFLRLRSDRFKLTSNYDEGRQALQLTVLQRRPIGVASKVVSLLAHTNLVMAGLFPAIHVFFSVST
jgi:hypothetical protein